MGRIYSGKPVKDTETAVESLVFSSLINTAGRNLRNPAFEMTITSHLQSDQQIDNIEAKKHHSFG